MTAGGQAAPLGAPSESLLLERGGELATLHALVDGVAAGQSTVAVVEGRAGIGKSRLLADVRATAASRGVRVLGARGSELERQFPYGVVRQLFEPLMAEPGARKRLLAGAAEPAASVFAAVTEPGDDQVHDVSYAALHGLYWLVANASTDSPMLMVVDDLHWCDRPSLRFLAYVARRLDELPAGLVTGLRSTDPGTDPGLVAEIVEDPATVAVRPGPLSPDGTGDLVRARLGERVGAGFIDACHRATGGNPLLLRQLLTSVEAEGIDAASANADVLRNVGPRAVSRTVLLRLARLSDDAGAVARSVAVLGDAADLPAVAALAGVSESRVAEATAELAQVEILRPEPPLGFVHPLVRDAVYHALTPAKRDLQHARAAEVLEHAGAPPEQVAAHLLMVPRRGETWVVELLRAAARTAVRKGAPESAITYLQRAVEEPPDPDEYAGVLLELGLVETHVSGEAAFAHLKEAFERLRDPADRAEAAYWMARILFFTDRANEGATVARNAAQQLPEGLEDQRLALLAVEATAATFGGDPDAVPDLSAYRNGVAGDGPGAKMLAAATAYDWMVKGGPAGGCADLAVAALADGVLFEAENGLSWVTAIVVLGMADRDDAMDYWDAALEAAHRRGSAFAVLSVDLWRGWTLLRRGELEDAEASLRDAIDKMKAWGSSSAMTYPIAFLAEVLLARGDLAAAREMLDREAAPLPSDGRLFWRQMRLEVLLGEGKPEEALALLEEERVQFERVRCPAWSSWRSIRARILDRLGRHDEALEQAREEVELARAWGTPGAIGRALAVFGTLEGADGIGHLQQAVEQLSASPSRLELARALAALGASVRRQRRPTEAREPLRRALELAEACGATALAGEVRTELHAAGARPRSSALSGPESLTASERRVVGLAVEGQSNRDIAQTLFVTPKTVEVHLSNAYRKLGIRSRRELPAAMAAA